MSNDFIQSAENNLARVLSPEITAMTAAHSQTLAGISSEIWGGRDLISQNFAQNFNNLENLGINAAAADSGFGTNAARLAADVAPPASPADAHLPGLQIGDFKDTAVQVFDKLDPNHTGQVSTEQLAKAVQDHSITGQDAEALAALYSMKHDQMQIQDRNSNPNYHGPKGFIPANVNPHELTLSEIQNLPDSIAKVQTDRGMLSAIDNPDVLASLDTAKTGRISAADLAKSPFSGFASTYDQLSQNYAAEHLSASDQAQVKRGGLTYDELSGLLKEEGFEAHEAAGIKNRLRLADESEANIGQALLYSDVANPLNSIKRDDVHQNEAGDCYFDSVLSSVAGQNPALIKNAIHDNNNGTYTVTFPGDPTRPITVDAPSETELDLYNSATKDGVWANVMEKAFADHQLLFGNRNENDDTAEDAISGGRAETSLKLLTGATDGTINSNYVDPRRAADPAYNYQQRIDSAMQQAAAGATNGDYTFLATHAGSDTIADGLEPNHVYSVLAYQDGPNGGTYTLRNPWGDHDKKMGDEFTISGDKLALAVKSVTTAPVS